MGDVAWNLEEARKLYLDDGWTYKELSVRYETAQSNVQRWLKQSGMKGRGPAKTEEHRRRLGDAKRFDLDLDRVRKLAAEGWTTSRIGEDLGVSEECVRERMVAVGIPRGPVRPVFRGPDNYWWKGGLSVDKHGYIYQWCPDHPAARKNHTAALHRLIYEAHLGRYLERGEVVDHIDGDTSNNHTRNLRVFATNAEHLRVTLTGSVQFLGSSEQRDQSRLRALQLARRRVVSILQAIGVDGRELLGPIPWDGSNGRGLLALCEMPEFWDKDRRESAPDPD